MSSTCEVDLFYGPFSPHSAAVYLQVRGLAPTWQVAGQIRGPFCRHARTLSSTYRFLPHGNPTQHLWHAAISDPCYWSPDLPALYRIEIECRDQGVVVQQIQREVGLRFLGPRRHSFYCEGKRWVLRAVSRTLVEPTPLTAWREMATAMVIDGPDPSLCAEASREGVLLVVRNNTLSEESLRAAIQWPSVGFLSLPAEGRNPLPSHLAGHVVWLQESRGYEETAAPPPRLIDADQIGWEAIAAAARQGPVVAARKQSGTRTLADARAACDALQRDIAPYGDCAGYVILASESHDGN